MAQQLWSATIDRLGEFTAELFEGGCYILFGEPLPEALAEVSIVHTTRQAPTRPIAAGDSILAFVGVSTAGGQNISYTLQQIDATGKASKLRDEQFDSTAVIWSAWAPDASGIVIQRAGSDPNQNTFVYLPASDAAAIELKLSGQGTPVWGAPGT